MHDRHWVGRNRGKNLKSDKRIWKTCFNVNLYLKMTRARGFGASDNVTVVGSPFAVLCFLVVFLEQGLASEPLHVGPFYP